MPANSTPVPDNDRATSTVPDPKASAVRRDEDREYDHRGIPMPKRTRVGGIITPQ